MSRISSINRYSIIINGNKNIKSCEFCVKILHRECCEVAKKLWFWWNIIYQLYGTNIFYAKVLILQNHFQLDNPYAFPKGILYDSQRSCRFVYFYSSFVYCLSDDAVHCIESAIFYIRRSIHPLLLLSIRDKKIAMTFHENQRLNIGNQYPKDDT